MQSLGAYHTTKLEDWTTSSEEKTANWVLIFNLVLISAEKCFLKFCFNICSWFFKYGQKYTIHCFIWWTKKIKSWGKNKFRGSWSFLAIVSSLKKNCNFRLFYKSHGILALKLQFKMIDVWNHIPKFISSFSYFLQY